MSSVGWILAEPFAPRDHTIQRVSWHTVTQHLAADVVEPKFATPEHPSKIEPCADKQGVCQETEPIAAKLKSFSLRQTWRGAAHPRS